MKRHIFLLLFALFGMSAMAQGVSTGDIAGKSPIDIRGSMVYVDDCRLSKHSAAACFSSLGGVDRSADYLKYRAGYKTGLGLTIGGASLAVVGAGTAFVGFVKALQGAFDNNDHNSAGAEAVMYIGAGSCVIGAACFLAGIPTICVYKTRLNRLEKVYNASLQIGAGGNGVSMAICF